MAHKVNFWAYSTCLIILFLSMGYALLNVELSIKATGVIDVPSGVRFSEVILSNEVPTLNTGDGLYSYNSKYYYSGADVDNYVEFNDELWRVLSIEEDGKIKIVKDSVVSIDRINELEELTSFWLNSGIENQHYKAILNEGKIPYDIRYKRPVNTLLENNYCVVNSNGCNAYYIGTFLGKDVHEESYMKKYLETVYFPNMTALARKQIKNYELHIGIVETNKKINVVLDSEDVNTVTGPIGLLNISDYVYATQDTTCRNSFDKEACANNNWLMLSNYQFYLLNGKLTSTNAQVWTVNIAGKITSQDANNRFYLRPVVTLNENITATGTGDINDKYMLGDIL